MESPSPAPLPQVKAHIKADNALAVKPSGRAGLAHPGHAIRLQPPIDADGLPFALVSAKLVGGGQDIGDSNAWLDEMARAAW